MAKYYLDGGQFTLVITPAGKLKLDRGRLAQQVKVIERANLKHQLLPRLGLFGRQPQIQKARRIGVWEAGCLVFLLV